MDRRTRRHGRRAEFPRSVSFSGARSGATFPLMQRDFLMTKDFWHARAARIFLLLLMCWVAVAPALHVCDLGFARSDGVHVHAHQYAHSHDAESAASTRASLSQTPPLAEDHCGDCLACLLASMPGQNAVFFVLTPSLREVSVPAPPRFLSHSNGVFRGEYSRGPPVA